MKSLWNDKEAANLKGIDLLVYRSRLIGREPNLVLWGGGNTSMKLAEKGPDGRNIRVLRVKGSGSDLKICVPENFSPLPLKEAAAAESIAGMTDEEMVAFLQKILLNPNSPRPSIEALMHAFIPEDHVDHSHADAILAVTNTKEPKKIFEKIFGKDCVWIPYTKPGFPLAKAVACVVRHRPGARAAILEKHGIFTWGDTAKESYETMIEMVTRAENFTRRALHGKKPLGCVAKQRLDKRERKKVFDGISADLKEYCSGVLPNTILLHSDNTKVLDFVNSKKAGNVSQRGPATPEHPLRTKRMPLFCKLSLRSPRRWPAEIRQAMERYKKAYTRYFEKFATPQDRLVDACPRALLIPQVGLIAIGKDEKSAIIVRDILQHTLEVMKGGMAAGGYQSLPENEIFKMEYWPLELCKLTPSKVAAPASVEAALSEYGQSRHLILR